MVSEVCRQNLKFGEAKRTNGQPTWPALGGGGVRHVFPTCVNLARGVLSCLQPWTDDLLVKWDGTSGTGRIWWRDPGTTKPNYEASGKSEKIENKIRIFKFSIETGWRSRFYYYFSSKRKTNQSLDKI